MREVGEEEEELRLFRLNDADENDS